MHSLILIPNAFKRRRSSIVLFSFAVSQKIVRNKVPSKLVNFGNQKAGKWGNIGGGVNKQQRLRTWWLMLFVPLLVGVNEKVEESRLLMRRQPLSSERNKAA